MPMAALLQRETVGLAVPFTFVIGAGGNCAVKIDRTLVLGRERQW
jgi:hypothetical protein